MKDNTERPYHHGDLRRVVIETAMAMLQEEKGWQFTLREVARRAGVSHAAPYKHFPDKAALLAELALIGFDRLREALMAAQPASASNLREALFPVALAYLAFGEANPALYRLMFGADAGKPSEIHLSDRALAAFGIVTEFLTRSQEAGLVRKRPVRGQAAACWAQMHGLTMLAIDGLLLPEKVGHDAITEALTALLEGIQA